MVLTIAVCISILVLIDAPQASRLVSWQALYLAGFSWALFRRNWGNTVVREVGTTATEVESNYYITFIEPGTQMLLLSFCSAGAGLCWMLHLAFIAIWFRICGWRVSRISDT